MHVLHVILIMIAMGLYSYFVGNYCDQKTMIRVQEFIARAPKGNHYASMHRIMGYGGGWAKIDNRKFGFCTDKYLFAADAIIDNSPSFKVVYREQQ